MFKVSVVVPVYNVEKYLDECISSICASTLHDIEILLIDDGSTDASGVIAEQWRKKDGRIKVFHKTNGGLSDARNYGIQLCQGEYIAFVDSDDRIAPEMFEDMYRACRQNGTKVSICGVYLWNPELNKTKRIFDLPVSGCYPVDYEKMSDMYHNTAWRKLYHHTLFKDGKCYFPKGRIHEDIGVWWIVMAKILTLSVVNKPLYFYRQNNKSSICAEKNAVRHASDTLYSYAYGLNRGIECITENLKQKWLKAFCVQYLKNTTVECISSEAMDLNTSVLKTIKKIVGDVPVDVKKMYYQHRIIGFFTLINVNIVSLWRLIFCFKIRCLDRDILSIHVGKER